MALEAVRAVDEVGTEPPPEVLLVELGESTVDVEVLFWTDARQIEMRRTMSHAIEAVKAAFDDHGIEMPCRLIALQATSSFEASLRGRVVTPGDAVANSSQPAANERNGA